eukprot:8480-Alexandrium_andersonii.AAC.1
MELWLGVWSSMNSGMGRDSTEKRDELNERSRKFGNEERLEVQIDPGSHHKVKDDEVVTAPEVRTITPW